MYLQENGRPWSDFFIIHGKKIWEPQHNPAIFKSVFEQDVL